MRLRQCFGGADFGARLTVEGRLALKETEYDGGSALSVGDGDGGGSKGGCLEVLLGGATV